MTESTKPLVVATDDDPHLVELYAVFLKQMFGAKVLTTTNSYEAVNLALEQVPDLFITDLCKPGFSGVDLVRKLRRNPKTMYVPIWVISGQIKTKLGRMAKSSGANLLIPKPFSTEEFKNHGENLFNRFRKGRFDYLLELSAETQDVDYKRQFSATKDDAAAVAKDIIAIGNFGGGYLVFGFAEKEKGSFTPVGLNSKQLSSLEVTTFNKAIREYIDPPHAVKCHRVRGGRRKFIVVEIPPANDRLLLAKKQNDAAKLYPGRIYTRTTACESAEVRENYELRRMLERITSNLKNEKRPMAEGT